MLTFTQADVIRETGATSGDLYYWNRIGVIRPHKTATSSGEHRQYSLLDVIEVAQAVDLKRVGSHGERIKLLLALQRKQLAALPPQFRAVAAWTTYVRMIRRNADDPSFRLPRLYR